DSDNLGGSEAGLSSLMDSWLLLRNLESNGERNRGIFILKSRGMAHSNQIREFILTDHGVKIRDVYAGRPGGFKGPARTAQEARERAENLVRQQEIERKQRELESKRQAMEAQIAALRAAFASDSADLEKIVSNTERAVAVSRETLAEMADAREGGRN